jgi:alkylhydroperoxidase/carboxymuconolactone decarboxylase family protein YurZ
MRAGRIVGTRNSKFPPPSWVSPRPYCIKGHTKAALRQGASQQELMEAIWVSAEMRAGGAYAHSVLAIEEMEKVATAKTA